MVLKRSEFLLGSCALLSMLLDLPGKVGRGHQGHTQICTHCKGTCQVHTPPFKLSESVTSRSSVAVEMNSMMLTVAQAKGIR